MTEPDTWEALKEIGHTTHLIVWVAVRECEADADVEVVNSASVLQAALSLTGEYRNHESILNSMNRLRETGVLKRTEAQDWHGGYDWRYYRTRATNRRSIRRGVGSQPRDRRYL